MHINAPKYYREFACIGSDCETSCCDYPWHINVDKKHYKKIKKVFDRSNHERLIFKKNIKRARPANNLIVTDRNYAQIVYKADGRCGFLACDNLCDLIKDHGAEVLPDACENYPRVNNAIENKQVEAGLSLSCPEAVRKCLLDENSFKIEKIDKIGLGDRDIKANILVKDGVDSYYNKQVLFVNDYVGRIIQDTSYPLKTRLFILTFFASKSVDFYYQGVLDDPSSGLVDVMSLLGSSETKKQLHNQLAEISIPSEIGMGVLQECIIAQPTISDGIPRLLNTLFLKVIKNVRECIKVSLNIDLGGDITTSRDEMLLFWRVYSNRKIAVNKKYQSHIDKRLANYCIHYWTTTWYVGSKNLLLHMRSCLANKAIISFLFYCHPAINDLLTSVEDVAADSALIDSVLVEVVTSYTRDSESSNSVSGLLEKHLDKKQFVSFAPIMLLLDF